MTHSGQKGFGMTKHGRSGYATRSPRFRFLQKLEAQRTIARTALGSRTRNSRSKSYSIPGSQHEPDELAESGLRRLAAAISVLRELGYPLSAQSTDRAVAYIVRPRNVGQHLPSLPTSDRFLALMAGGCSSLFSPPAAVSGLSGVGRNPSIETCLVLAMATGRQRQYQEGPTARALPASFVLRCVPAVSQARASARRCVRVSRPTLGDISPYS